MNKICIYLRKSRADEELEKALGEGETLNKHRKALLKFAKEKKLNIIEIKEELVSADSIFFRPKMVELLKEVETKKYTGVLVMDIQRLGRGDTEDQGIITRIFKESHTKIITPQKTYDLDDDLDEDYFEFESFMGRKEYKMIKKRMQGGRVRSIEDGNYIATNAPYGYDISHVNRCRILKPNPQESEIVKLIYAMYCEGNGAGSIAKYLNNLGYKTKFGNDFSRSSIIFILKNPVYIGKITWKKKDIRKSKDPNKVKDTRTRDKSEWIIADGKHKSIIDKKTWNIVQEILNNKYHIPYQLVNGPTNPLAGVIICSKCKNKMVGRTSKSGYRLICKNNKCDTVSHKFDVVEKAILNSLENYLKEHKLNITKDKRPSNLKLYERQLNNLNKELIILNEQRLKLFDFLETGIYTEDIFLERSKNLDKRISETTSGIKKINEVIDKENNKSKKEDVVKYEKFLDGYKKTRDIKLKNESMKSLVFKIEYTKNKKGNDFKIELFPKFKP
ncbi:recombinase [Clostridium sporogenes]|uniref:recombinase family protein n=1 Tax=Clostridium botulinum TaxID=1491 RepID=UPI000717AACA|nr:recombinase family protein [Clostridium botulinum]KRU24048.1 recombinase [Clostridium sporogenes]KRU24110.1 recombinase [Clostridium sporogenes]KRU28836.1 recombinase [Clostridium sporogenes]KRU35749.1 recombinase [Clostridium sporogenes]KRU47106.1 recombinase [Clostridium sporogenes]